MTDDKNKWQWPFPGYTYKINQSVTSHGQTGGITAHTVNLAPLDRHLDEPTKRNLLQALPKGRTVKVQAPLGDGEATRFAHEIWDFLRTSGFAMHASGLAQVVWIPPPQGQIIDVETEPGIAIVIIGSRLP